MRTFHGGLHTFCSAAAHLSFKKAANELSVTPSAVSHQIAELEEQLGAKLFMRQTRAVSLTEEGYSLFEEINPCLQAIEQAISKARCSVRGRHSLLLKVPEFFASELLMPMMSEFMDSNPEIELNLVGTDPRDSHNHEADIEFIISRSAPQAWQKSRLIPIRYIPACGRCQYEKWQAEGLSKADLFSCKAILLHKSQPEGWSQWLKSAGLPDSQPERTVILDSMFALARSAEQGLGITLIPLPVSGSWFDSGELIALHDHQLVSKDYYWAALNGNSSNRMSALYFIRWLERKFDQLSEINSSVG